MVFIGIHWCPNASLGVPGFGGFPGAGSQGVGSVGFSRSHTLEPPQGGKGGVDVLSAIQHNSLIFFVGGLF